MLTEAQYKILSFIRSFFDQNGYSPTIAEIAKGIGIKSRSSVHRHLQAIKDAEYIDIVPNKRRNIQLIEQAASNNYSLPLIGKIAAGQPIAALPQQESIDIAALFLGANRYILEVEGDSMIGDNICDGDLVVCEQANTARNGTIIVALIDQEEATLKRIFYNADKTLTLMPSNPRLKPMIYPSDKVQVQGIFVGLLRIEHR